MTHAHLNSPIHVTGVGCYAGNAGYNIHTNGFFSALSRTLAVTEIDLQDTTRTVRKQIDAVCLLNQRATHRHFVNIQINYGNAPLINTLPGPWIAYTVWESTRLPPDWITALRSLPYVWVPTTWGRNVMISNGLPEDHISVIPEGVDGAVFHPNAQAITELQQLPGFKFVHISKYEERKGTEQLVRLFDQHFAPRGDSYLVLLSHNAWIEGFDINKQIESLGLGYRERVLCISRMPHPSMVANVLAACDAAVFPTRAEGWGLPIIEAMACGLPTIVTNYSGPTAFANSGNALLLDYRLAPVTARLFDSPDSDWGQWAEPDRDHLVHLMERVMQDRAETKELGTRAARDIAASWQWHHAAEKAHAWLANTFP